MLVDGRISVGLGGQPRLDILFESRRAEWYTRESQKLVVVMTLRVRVSPQAPSRTVLEGASV